MHTSKILVGNSGDKVYLHEDKVIKEAGVYPKKFKQQMDWLVNCWLNEELAKPASKLGKRTITITEEWSFKVLFSIPNDLIFGHLLTNVANDRLTNRFT